MNSNENEPVLLSTHNCGRREGRVVFHHGAGARADPPADIDAPIRSGVTGGIARIALDGNGRAGIQPAHIRRCGTFDNDLGPGHAHGADPLSRVANDELERLALPVPQWAADILLPGAVDLEFRFPLRHGSIDLLEQVLGGGTLVVGESSQAFHRSLINSQILNRIVE
jgi:hypothetical protein